jgi:ABC-2 type transport system permease protein
MGHFRQETTALTMRWIRRQRREMGSIVFGLTQPLVWLVLFGYSFKGMAAGRLNAFGTENYLDFQAAGVVAFTVLGNALMGGIPVLFDRETGYLQKLLVMPISRASLLVSRFLFVEAFSLVQALVILGCALCMGVHIHHGMLGVLGILGAGALLCFGFTLISMALAFVFPNHAVFFGVVGFLTTPLLFVSNALVPLAMMPPWMRAMALVNPLTHAIDIMRGMVLGNLTMHVFMRATAALVVFDLVMLVWAMSVVRKRIE